MTDRSIKIGATIVVLVLAFAGLIWSTSTEGTAYYQHVDEVVVTRQTWEGKRLQLHGFVVPDSILRRPNTLDYRFKLRNNGAVVDASYSGVLPGAFKDGVEVVVRGRLLSDGFHVEPNGVVIKPPSTHETRKSS